MATSVSSDGDDGKRTSSDNMSAVGGYKDINEFSQVAHFTPSFNGNICNSVNADCLVRFSTTCYM